ncbi:transposable element Tc3 transposase [Trichonephila clavipes]|nr:transposable element Tc3 transposase [Trichonephila clavipes]
MRKTPTGSDCLIVYCSRCAQPRIRADKDILELDESLNNIIDTDSDNENEIKKCTSSSYIIWNEERHEKKSLRSRTIAYIAYSPGLFTTFYAEDTKLALVREYDSPPELKRLMYKIFFKSYPLKLTTSGCFYPSSNHWEVGGRPKCDKCGCRVRNCSQHRFTTLETISTYRNSYPGFSSGRPRGATPADDRYIVLQARRNRRQTTGEIARHTTQATGRPISRFTVARRLRGGGLFARRPVRCVPLTPAHRRRRSLGCREHRNWRDNEWGRVLFTDESRFSLSSDSYRILIWRERGSRNHPSNIIERDRYGGRGVLVWGGIMLASRTDLHIFDAGSVNGTRYCNEILLPYVRLLEALWVSSSFSWTTMHHWIGRHDLRISIPSSMYGFSRQTLGSSYLTTSNDSGASIGAARRMGSNASTTH